MSYQTIEITQQGEELHIKILESRIYLGVTDIFAEEMAAIVNEDFQRLVVNLEGVSVMNSSGIGVLIKARDEVSKLGKTIKLVKLQSLMTDIFNRMRLDTLFEIE